MYILVSLDCLIYLLGHISCSSHSCQLSGNQSVTFSFMWYWLKHQSVKYFIVHRVFMLFASVSQVSV